MLSGLGGDDRLSGGDGNDTLIGGVGRDILRRRRGCSDTFRYLSASETGATAGRATGSPTSRRRHRQIDLAAIDANSVGGTANDTFSFVGAAAFSGTAGELRARAAGSNTLVSGDLDGDAVADFQILLTGTQTLSAGDFLLQRGFATRAPLTAKNRPSRILAIEAIVKKGLIAAGVVNDVCRADVRSCFLIFSTWILGDAMAQFPAMIELSSLNGANGFKLSGVAAGDDSGGSVASAGDVNGDGFDDLIVGASGADPHGRLCPARATWCSARPRASPPTSTSRRLDGSQRLQAQRRRGMTTSRRLASPSAGDVNGDGFADLIVGAYGADPNGSQLRRELRGVRQGARASPPTSTCRRLDGSQRLQAQRRGGSRLQRPLGRLGRRRQRRRLRRPDRRRLMAPIRTAVNVGRELRGVRQGARASRANLDLSTPRRRATASSSAASRPVDRSGCSVASAGDVNGDGFADLIVGARIAPIRTAPIPARATWCSAQASGFARQPRSFDASTAANGFKLSGVAAGDRSGRSVSVGRRRQRRRLRRPDRRRPSAPIRNGDASGASYVVFGKAAGFAANLDLSTLNGSNGFKLSGAGGERLQRRARSPSAGDVNGDGFADLIIGAARRRSERRRFRRELRGVRQGVGLRRQPRPLDARRQQRLQGQRRGGRRSTAARRSPRPAT